MTNTHEITVPMSAFIQDGSEHPFVRKKILAIFGHLAVVAGVDPSAIDSLYERRSTFGVPVNLLGKNNLRDDDPLTYASEGDLVVYDRAHLIPKPNYEFEIPNPRDAILGRVKVKYTA